MKKPTLQNLRIGIRIMIALALPSAGLLILAVWMIVAQFRVAYDMRGLREIADLAPVVSALVHELQIERGLSAATMSGAAGSMAERLQVQHAKTDVRRAALLKHLAVFTSATEPAEADADSLHARITAAEEGIGHLDGLRQLIAAGAIGSADVTTAYAEIITRLIGIIEQMPLMSTQAELTRVIFAYTQIINAKEQTGLERAAGAGGLAAGGFDPTLRARLIGILNQQRHHLKEFEFFATPQQRALLEDNQLGVGEAEVLRLRRLVLRSDDRGAAKIDAAHWFDTLTRKIERLKTVEDSIARDLAAQAAAIEQQVLDGAMRLSLLALVLLTLAVTLAAAIARGIILPLERTTRALGRLAAADDSAVIEDSARGDEIGALARAAQVFREQLQKSVETQAQLKSAAALRLHHQALSSITQGVLITDMQRHAIHANLAFNKIFRLAASAFPDDPPLPLGSPESAAACLAELDAAFTGGTSFHDELELQRADGTPFWCEVTVTPVLDAADRPTHLVGILRDITESRQVEQELRIAATAFESLHGMMVTDARGIILRVNQAFVDMTGYTTAEAVGQSPAILKSGRHEPEFYAAMWRQLAISGAWSGEIWDRRKNGEIYPKWQTISAVSGPDGRISHYVSAFSDISERKEAERLIHDLAFYDPLTHLPNRRLLQDRLQQALSLSERTGRRGALLFIDLDQFKTLNDTLGHDMGDLLLIEVAERLRACLRDSDTAARLGGDEFVVMLEELDTDADTAATQTETVGEKILALLNRDYALAGRPYHSTPSIGVTLYRGRELSLDELMKRADLAMYQAKAAGRNTLRFFDPAMQATVSARSALEADLREGLRNQQFLLFYQPQVDGSGRVTGAEALVRWRHPERGMVSPAEFIPLAEDTGLILPLGLWVLETACERLALWGKRPETADLTLAVNVSARQLRHVDFVDQVLAAIDSTGANPRRLKLELTESLLLDDIENTIAKMSALKARGVSFALDDFGTGYSSLAYLKRLPLDQLKIDQSFVRDVLSDPNDAIIARAIVALGQSLGLAVIAEGVETEAQREFLAANNCLAFQGYLFGRPEPANDTRT